MPGSRLARFFEVRERLGPQIERRLDPGETIEAIIPASGTQPSGNSWTQTFGPISASGAAGSAPPMLLIVATDRRILIFRWSGPFPFVARLRGVYAETRRDVRIGPLNRVSTPCELVYPPVWIGWISRHQVAAADEAMARRAAAAAPPGASPPAAAD